NGIQDADEPGIAGVAVQLFDSNNTLLATAVIDSAGNYYFNSGPGASTPSVVFGVNLQPNMNYQLRVAVSQPALTGLVLTLTNADPSPNGDARDNDGVLVGANAVITLTTGGPGFVDHTFDYGFTKPAGDNTISGFVYVDANNNCVFDAGETPIP